MFRLRFLPVHGTHPPGHTPRERPAAHVHGVRLRVNCVQRQGDARIYNVFVVCKVAKPTMPARGLVMFVVYILRCMTEACFAGGRRSGAERWIARGSRFPTGLALVGSESLLTRVLQYVL